MKEKWIDDVMGSLDGMNRVQAPTDLHMRVTEALKQPQVVRTVAFPIKQWTAAAVLLLALNIGSVVYFTEHHDKKELTSNTNPLAAEIQSESTYNY